MRPIIIPSYYPRMSSIRGLNSPTLQAAPNPSPIILNMTNNTLTSYLRSNTYNQNNTADKLNILLSDLPSPILDNLTQKEIIIIISFILAFMLVTFIWYNIIHYLDKKGINRNYLFTLNPLNWIKKKYTNNNKMEVLPMYRPKKAKESPFVSAMPMPQILPQCPRLEGAEKGQNNLQVRFSIPYRRLQSSSDNLPAEEHRITITTTTIQQSPQISKV